MCTDAGLGGFVACRALSENNDDPTKASRPWDSVIFHQFLAVFFLFHVSYCSFYFLITKNGGFSNIWEVKPRAHTTWRFITSLRSPIKTLGKPLVLTLVVFEM